MTRRINFFERLSAAAGISNALRDHRRPSARDIDALGLSEEHFRSFSR